MKFIYFSVLCFNLTCLNHSFAMEEGSSIRVASRQPFLDVPLNQTNGIHGTCKDLPPTDPKDYRYHDQRFYGRSGIYNLDYPRMSMIHSYHQEGAGPAGLSVPFSACLPFEAVSVPQSLKDKMPSLSSHPKIAFSFVVQAIEKGSGKARFYSLKPQYQMYPGAKMLMNPDEVQGQKFSGPLQWIVIPGAEGSVLPEKKDNEEGLLADSVSVHRSGGKPFPDYMILSGDVMHLTGIDSSKSVDAYDLVIFDDITAVTYRWLLADKDLETFNTALVRANTFGEIVHQCKKVGSIQKLLEELERFLGLVAIQESNKESANIEWTDGHLFNLDEIADKSYLGKYNKYFGEFLPILGESFRKYNAKDPIGATLGDRAILDLLFPHLLEDEFPSPEVARKKFDALSKAGRPYARLFNPPQESDQ